MTDDLSNALWHVGEIFTEIDDRIDYWNGLMNYMINCHAPTRRKRVRENDVPTKQFWKTKLEKIRVNPRDVYNTFKPFHGGSLLGFFLSEARARECLR